MGRPICGNDERTPGSQSLRADVDRAYEDCRSHLLFQAVDEATRAVIEQAMEVLGAFNEGSAVWARAVKRASGLKRSTALQQADRVERIARAVQDEIAQRACSNTELLESLRRRGIGCGSARLERVLASLERERAIVREGRGRQGARLWIVRSS